MASRKIRVLFVIERLARAGTELALLKVLNALDRSRFELHLCCLNDEMTDKSLLPPDIPYHTLGAGWNLAGPALLGVYLRLRRLIREVRPDVVHTFLFVSHVLGSFAARKEGVRAVVASRGRMGIEWQASLLHRLAQRAADRRTDRILCKTAAIADEIARVEKVPSARIHVIPNGVDTNRFAFLDAPDRETRDQLARQHALRPDVPWILAVGNLKPIKDHMTFIRATSLLRKEMDDFQVLVLGKGESEAALREMIQAQSLQNHVCLPGSMDDVLPYLHAADLFVAPSLSEGMPNALLEAMAVGLPSLLSDIPGHRETAGDDACYFPVRDAETLSKAIARHLASLHNRSTQGFVLRQRVESGFSLDRMVQRIQDLYEGLVKP